VVCSQSRPSLLPTVPLHETGISAKKSGQFVSSLREENLSSRPAPCTLPRAIQSQGTLVQQLTVRL
jgi:hypothetical protein